MHPSLLALAGLALVRGALSSNFPFEAVQLDKREAERFPAIAFADGSALRPRRLRPRCKAFPGSDDWPSDDEWAHLNSSMHGSLLKPTPAAVACYDGAHYDEAECEFLLADAGNTRFYNNNPLTVLTQWPQGNTCPASIHPEGECTQGGFPAYVANVSTVRDIQAAVNFARNKNVRLVIKCVDENSCAI